MYTWSKECVSEKDNDEAQKKLKPIKNMSKVHSDFQHCTQENQKMANNLADIWYRSYLCAQI